MAASSSYSAETERLSELGCSQPESEGCDDVLKELSALVDSLTQENETWKQLYYQLKRENEEVSKRNLELHSDLHSYKVKVKELETKLEMDGRENLDKPQDTTERLSEVKMQDRTNELTKKNFFVESTSMSGSEVEDHRRRRREITGKNVVNPVESFSGVDARGSHCPEISLKRKARTSRRTQGHEDEEQVRFVLVVLAFLVSRWMNFNDENNDDNGNERIGPNTRAQPRDIENANETTFDPWNMSTYKISHFVKMCLYAITAVLMGLSLAKYAELGIFNSDGYNVFLLLIGAAGSLFGTVLPGYIRRKYYDIVYGQSKNGFASRVGLMVLDILLCTLTTIGSVRLIRCLKGRASLIPLGLNLVATIILRITQLNDADHGYTDMLVALFVTKVDEEYKKFRHRDLWVNFSAGGWMSIRIIGTMMMSECQGERNVRINIRLVELRENLENLERRLTNSENQRSISSILASLHVLRRIIRES